MKTINELAFEYAYEETSDKKILKIDQIMNKL